MLSVPEAVPAAPLRLFRVVVGLVAMAKAVEFGASPYLGTVADPILPTPAWTALAAVQFAAAALVVAGIRARAAALVTGLCVFGFLWGAGYYANHSYLLATLAVMLSFTECASRSERVWGPPVYLLRAQISIVYAFAAIAKINFDFLSGNGLASWGFHSMLAPRFLLAMPYLPAMAIGTVMCEMFVAVALWVPRLRPFAVAVGVLLHAGMIVFISPGLLGVIELGMFAAMMIGGYLLFLQRLPDALARRLPAALVTAGG